MGRAPLVLSLRLGRGGRIQAHVLFTALPRVGKGTWLEEGSINICK